MVQCTGRPVPSVATERYADALLYAWQSGTESGRAVARLLFGEVSPSGRLPISVPRSTGQIPIYYARKPLGKMRDFQDYMPYKDQCESPLYPFGFGLTYSQFSYDDFSIVSDELKMGCTQQVKVRITNQGECQATEVVQCFIRQLVASTTRPLKELKDFKRVTLLPGESQEVVMTLTPEKMAFYGGEKCFSQEASEIEVYVGSDSTTTMKQTFKLVP